MTIHSTPQIHVYLELVIIPGNEVFTDIIKMKVKVVVTQLCLTHYDTWTVAHQASLPMEFSRQEYWSGLPWPSPGDLPNPELEPRSPTL